MTYCIISRSRNIQEKPENRGAGIRPHPCFRGSFREVLIIPNHVHLLIESLVHEQAKHQGKSVNYPVTDSLRLLKGRSARDCNLELKRTGSFWQHESYDHVVRDQQELQWTIQYILNNPLKAGLVKEWKDWKFTYVNPELGKW